MPVSLVRTLLSVALWIVLVPAHGATDADADGETMTLTTAAGESFTAYRSGPTGARYGIVLIHESLGLTADVRAYADWLGRNGHRVIALDLFKGRTASSPAEASALMASVDQKSADAKYRAAAKIIKAPGRKLITMGWEFGGTQALQANAALAGQVAASVVYDAVLSSDGPALREINTPVLGMFARGQSRNSVDRFRAFETAMKRKRKPVQIAFYEPTTPTNDEGAAYNGDAARAVWGTTTAFFKKYVK